MTEAIRSSARIVRLFWIVIALAALAAMLSILCARDLVYDGSFYLLGTAADSSFQFFEPARRTVHILQQCFAVGGERLGIRNLWVLGQLFSLGTSGWPVVLTLLCWFALPRLEKSWIIGPLLNLAFAIPMTDFIGISETIIASCLLWLTFFLVMFRLDNSLGSAISVIVAAACAFSHESAIVFLVLIAFVAASHLKTSHRIGRVAALGVIALSTGGALNMLRWILHPRSTVERGDFLVSLLGGFLGSPLAPNVAALASAVAGVAIVIALLNNNRVAVAAGWLSCGALACAFVVILSMPDQVIVPSRFFAARGVPVALSTLLASGLLWLHHRNLSPARFATAPVLTIVLGLSIFQFLTQAVITTRWESYVNDLAGLAASRKGGVTHTEAMSALDPERTRFRRELLESWSVEPLSILLAPHGRVQAIVLAAPSSRWVPYRLDDPAGFPHLPELDWSRFCPKSPCA